ncbi:hypothetical protein E5E03_00345 [Helicobacter pylori]|nr:hypothetical protein [Helicobacter pylori]WRG87009.1 hypothetical protein E5E03_00345 [Helicobacter pylori]
MIKLNGLNKTLKTSLLAGGFTRCYCSLNAKPLLSDEDLLKRVKLHNIKEDTLTSCNAKVDGSQYLNSGWNLSKEFPQEYREKIFECVEEEKHKQALNLINKEDTKDKEELAKKIKEIKEKAKVLRQKFMAFEMKEHSKEFPNKKQLQTMLENAFDNGAESFIDDWHERFGGISRENTYKALGIKEYSDEGKILAFGERSYIRQYKKDFEESTYDTRQTLSAMANMSGENDYKITWLKPKYQLHSSNNIKPLMSNTELLNMIELTNIKKEYVMGCNMEIDGSKYPIHKDWGFFGKAKVLETWRNKIWECIKNKVKSYDNTTAEIAIVWKKNTYSISHH